MRDDKRQAQTSGFAEVIPWEVGGAAQGADNRALFVGCFPGQSERSRQPAAPRLRRLRTVSALMP